MRIFRKGSGKLFKRLLSLVLALFALYSLWFVISITGYRKWRSNVPQKSVAPPFYEIRGVYHIHTKFSDGLAGLDKIASIAKSSGLDFIVTADHGSPNRASLTAGGWKNGLLCLTGSELATSRGHLVALGFNPPERRFPQNADLAAREITARGGFSIIAHPFNKTRWSWGPWAGYSGIEIIDSDTMIKKNALSTLPFLPALVLKPGLYLLKILNQPVRTLKKWDELNAVHNMAGYFSADAHFFYRAAFSLFRLYGLLEKPLSPESGTAREQVLNALRNGSFYNAIEAAADASGFRFWAEKDGAAYPMGSVFHIKETGAAGAPGQPPLTLKATAPFSFAKELRFIYNGRTIFSTKDPEMSLIPLQPGAYRVEVYLREKTPLRTDVPWIVSNPIFIRKDAP